MDTWMGLPFAFRPRLQHRLLTLYGRGGGPAVTAVAARTQGWCAYVRAGATLD